MSNDLSQPKKNPTSNAIVGVALIGGFVFLVWAAKRRLTWPQLGTAWLTPGVPPPGPFG